MRTRFTTSNMDAMLKFLRDESAYLRKNHKGLAWAELKAGNFDTIAELIGDVRRDMQMTDLTKEKLLALATFGARVLSASRSELGDLDGGWLQDTAEECGLLEAVEVTEPCDMETCRCAECADFPVLCYRRTEAARALGEWRSIFDKGALLP